MPHVEFRIVETVDECVAAAQLVYREYLKRNYIRPNAHQIKLSTYHVLPTTATFIARHLRTKAIVATVTLVQDSPLGLPMDEVYKPELDALRHGGHRLAEATMLALDSELFSRSTFTLFHGQKMFLVLRLFKVMFDYVRSSTPVTELVACFNPKHQPLYDFLQLEPLGGLRAYHSANDHPALASHFNVAQMRQQARSNLCLKFLYHMTRSPMRFANKLAFTANDLRTLFCHRSDVFASASPTELAYFQRCYPCDPLDSFIPRASAPHPSADSAGVC